MSLRFPRRRAESRRGRRVQTNRAAGEMPPGADPPHSTGGRTIRESWGSDDGPIQATCQDRLLRRCPVLEDQGDKIDP